MFLKKKKQKKQNTCSIKQKLLLLLSTKKKKLPHAPKKKKNQPTSHEKKFIKNPTETQLQLPKKKPSHFIFLSSSPSQCCRMYMKKILITLNPSNCKSTVFLQYFLFFHPISNRHYLLLYSPFNILNSSQWLGVFFCQI